jgi:hypothetical protein
LARHTSQARLDEAEALAHMHGLADSLEEPIPLFHDRDRLHLFAINRGRVGENGVEMNNERRTELYALKLMVQLLPIVNMLCTVDIKAFMSLL